MDTSSSSRKALVAGVQVQEVLRMNGGEGDSSYARNSSLQKLVLLKALSTLEESIRLVYCSTGWPECLKMVDMGCSSGPNIFLPIWEIRKVVDTTCHRLKRKPPTLQVFLNDLPGNDFNTIFRSLPSFYMQIRNGDDYELSSCFIAAVPGSFYGRLFPANFIHLVYSVYSLHWLSKVPKGLVDEHGVAVNKGNIWISKTSPRRVHEAYLAQFMEDFSSFLKFRSEEMISGGHIVITVMSRDRNDESSGTYGSIVLQMIGFILNDFVRQGLIEEEELEGFNMPFYTASAEEVREVVENEGSFNIHRLQTYKLPWDAGINEESGERLGMNQNAKAEYITKRSKAALEPILATHFGAAIVEALFSSFYLEVCHYLETEEAATFGYTNIIFSLAKK